MASRCVSAAEQASTSSRCAGAGSSGRAPVRGACAIGRAELQRCAGSRFHEFSLWRGDAPVQSAPPPQGVVPGVRTVATPVLAPLQAMDHLYASVHANASHFRAFYSTELGGITTHPAVMVVHIDDHMVHSGHAVFDTALITDGHLYQLRQHLERFKRSAHMAGLTLPLSDPLLLRVILDTAAASRLKDGLVKFWVTPGRGGLGISRAPCLEPVLYIMVSSETAQPSASPAGLAACASPCAPKPAPYGTIKSTNYLPNVLAQIQAEKQGLDVGVFVDAEGHVLEGPNSNFAIITKDNVFVTPPFDSILSGITIQTAMQLLSKELESGKKKSSSGIVKVEQRPIHVDELSKAKEALLIGSTKLAVPITSWDGKPVGSGKPGPVAAAVAAMLLEHRKPSEESQEHVPVPYDSMIGRV